MKTAFDATLAEIKAAIGDRELTIDETFALGAFVGANDNELGIAGAVEAWFAQRGGQS